MAYLFSSIETTLGGAAAPGTGETIVITAGGGVIAPAESMLAAPATSGVDLTVAGLLSLNQIMLNGNDQVDILASAACRFGSDTGIYIQDITANGTVTNAGQIEAANGLAIGMAATDGIVTNTGLISAKYGVTLGNSATTGQSLVNAGTISTSEIGVQAAGYAQDVTNTGLIGTARGPAIWALGGTLSQGSAINVANSGVLQSGADQAVLIQMGHQNSTFHLSNTGEVTAALYAVQSIGASRDWVTNSGTLNGSVDLGAGDDRFDGAGGRLNGSIFLGEGDDTADLRAMTVTGPVYGGNGSDTYLVADSDLDIVETGAEIDSVLARCNYRLAANVENLTLLDGGNFAGIGNSAANRLGGNASDNRLIGAEGLDSLFGGFGDDRMGGGAQDDTCRATTAMTCWPATAARTPCPAAMAMTP